MSIETHSEITITLADWQQYGEPLRHIRSSVFVEEQGVPQDEEWDDKDQCHSTQHFIAYNSNGEAIGCLRILLQANGGHKITRVAVLRDWRGRGIGKNLVLAALKHILKCGNSIVLHAQSHSLAFYTQLGFIAEGETFMEAGIEHQRMVFETSLASLQSVYQDEVLRFDSALELRYHLANMGRACRRELLLSSDTLSDGIFRDSRVYDALSHFARNDRLARLRIVLHEAAALRERSLPLLDLVRRLPSKIELRCLGEGAPSGLESFICFDRKSFIYFNSEADYSGFACYSARVECERYRTKFHHAWEQLAFPSPELQQFIL